MKEENSAKFAKMCFQLTEGLLPNPLVMASSQKFSGLLWDISKNNLME